MQKAVVVVVAVVAAVRLNRPDFCQKTNIWGVLRLVAVAAAKQAISLVCTPTRTAGAN